MRIVKIKCKTFVIFFHQLLSGSFHDGFPEEVQSRDIKKIKCPDGIAGFKFFDVVEAVAEIDGKSVKLRSKKINQSADYYYGQILTRAEVARKVPKNQPLLDFMKSEGCDRIILTRTDNWITNMENTIVIED